ncbi:MAG: TIGR00270 family protein [Promethearchaeota archaeon]|nr:MAG: TIGR00270 family protein [Candidatus Lokiarchaeota archaeon]
MSERKDQDVCPICGGIIWGGGEKVLIEGAKIRVCQSCAQHGKKIVTKTRPSSRTREKYSKTQKTSRKPKKDYGPKVIIVKDYNQRIRRVREQRNLTQAKFAQRLKEKESLIRRIEAKKTKPTIKLAKKIENTYGIKLLKETGPVKVDTNKYMKKSTGSGGVSLGAFIKKKDD